MRKFPKDMKTKVSKCFRWIPKKDHGRLIATAMLVLPLGLGKFRHVLKDDPPPKKGQSLLIAAAMEFLLYISGNFDHNPSLGKSKCATNNFYVLLNSKKFLNHCAISYNNGRTYATDLQQLSSQQKTWTGVCNLF